MEKKWTNAQENAMKIHGKTVLVSAAAGSGKTATLTERIIRRITDTENPADISKMLVVTFTKTAAAELRSRIFAALSDALAAAPQNKHLAEQLMKIGSANISTIDSFYFNIVESNANALGLPTKLKIADEAEYALIANKTMEGTIGKFYDEDPDFPDFVECFASLRQFNMLTDIFLEIYDKLAPIPEGVEILRICAEKTEEEKDLDFFSTHYGEILKAETKAFIDHFYPILCSAVEFINSDEKVQKKYGNAFENDLNLCSRLYNAIEDTECGYKSVRDILLTYTPINLTGGKLNADPDIISEAKNYKALRDEFKETALSLAGKSFAKSPETIARAMGDTARYLHTLYRLLSEFEKAVTEEKLRLGILTFVDIRRLTLKLLVNPNGSFTNVAREYSQHFTDIYIDEYQDVDRVQDLIFRSISTPTNRFMVGDIKQSIYEFRGADPSLFAEYRAEFPAYTNGESHSSDTASIFMSNNFRCDKTIIDFTNIVCSKIFGAIADSIGYLPEDDLVFSKIYGEGAPERINNKVRIALIRSQSSKAKRAEDEPAPLSNHELEAEYIAAEIDRLIKSENKADGKPILPGDIAVLFQTKSMMPHVAEALKKRGIMSSQSNSNKYFESPDVLLMLCVLNVVNNPQRDTYLAGALRSALFGFTMEELINIRLFGDRSSSLFIALQAYSEAHDDTLAEKCKEFITTLEEWQYDAASLPIDRFLRILFDSKRFLATGIVSQPTDNGEGGNLLLLYEHARTFENSGFKGLYQFIEHINSMIKEEKVFDDTETCIFRDRVSLITIHKSKGLEFPVCFICDANHSIKSQESKESFVMDRRCGMALKISDESGMARINTPMREAILSKISSNQIEEKMRLLYVALTRARERLYVTAASSSEHSKLFDTADIRRRYFNRYTAMHSCSSFLDWILTACSDDKGDCFEIINMSYKDITPYEEKSDNTAQESPEPDRELLEKLKESFSFEYGYSKLAKVPSKLTVSRLYPDILDENDTSLELFTEIKKATVPDFFAEGKSAATSAERGTATHLFMQFCNFEYMSNYGVAEELARLQNKKFLPPNAASLVFTDEIDKFIDSELMQNILQADKVIREQRFNVKLSPDGFTSNAELLKVLQGEHLAVQGVIDLILVDENGDISLYDYKTDRLSVDELKDDNLAANKMQIKHGLQLSYYAKAAELLFGKPCKRIAVYSTHSSKLYDIKPLETVDILDSNL